MLLHCFLIYQDSMLWYLINNGELYSTYKGGTPSTRGRSSNWKGICMYFLCFFLSIGHRLLMPSCMDLRWVSLLSRIGTVMEVNPNLCLLFLHKKLLKSRQPVSSDWLSLEVPRWFSHPIIWLVEAIFFQCCLTGETISIDITKSCIHCIVCSPPHYWLLFSSLTENYWHSFS